MGAVNRCWDVSRFGELTVPDSAALRGNALTLEAWVRTNDPIDSGGGIGIFATNPYQGILFKGSSSSWADGYGLVRVDDSIRFFLQLVGQFRRGAVARRGFGACRGHIRSQQRRVGKKCVTLFL